MSSSQIFQPPSNPALPSPSPANPSASAFLASHLGKTLRITTTDSRVFVGQFKCTDRECNVILALTQEYRPPSDEAVKAAAAAASQSGAGTGMGMRAAGRGRVDMQFSSRYVGLVVVPGKHITKIEYEEWVGYK